MFREEYRTRKGDLNRILFNHIFQCIQQREVASLCNVIERIMCVLDRLQTERKKRAEVLQCLQVIRRCATCLHSIATTHQSLDEMVTRPAGYILVKLLWFLNSCHWKKCDAEFDRAKVEIIRLLTFITMYTNEDVTNGILDAFDKAAVVQGRPRFQCIIDCLKSESNTLVLVSMQFIMAVLSNVQEGPHDWQERILLRNEFYRLDFGSCVPVS